MMQGHNISHYTPQINVSKYDVLDQTKKCFNILLLALYYLTVSVIETQGNQVYMNLETLFLNM